MTRSKFLASFLGLLLVLGAALFLFWRSRPVPAPAPAAVAAASIQATPAPSFASAKPQQRVMELYATESARVGQIDPDPKATQARLEENARLLTPEEIQWLGAQAMDSKQDADGRFFAAYLLGLSHQESSVSVLGALAVMPLPITKNERLVEQERALRASAVEGACHACKEFPKAVRDTMLDVSSYQKDSFVGDRAHRCLYYCQTGKPIEDQDTDALERARSKKK